MNLVVWKPFREMRSLHDRMNRFFDEPFFPTPWLDGNSELGSWKPKVDISDHEDKIVIKAELPGVDKKNIEVDLKDHVLTLKGERSHEKEVKEENYYRKERSSGKFQRSFHVPAEVDADKVSADFKDGVLTIDIPKSEQEKPKKITVH